LLQLFLRLLLLIDAIAVAAVLFGGVFCGLNLETCTQNFDAQCVRVQVLGPQTGGKATG